MSPKRAIKKGAVTIVGFALVGLGIVLMPLPGPGLLVCVAGFAVLATEYYWAHRLLVATKRRAIDGQRKVAEHRLTYLGQHASALAMIAVATAFLVWPALPLASPVTATMLVIGGVVLITSAVMARRRYRVG